MISKRERSIPECEFYIGDGLAGSFTSCPYRHAGRGKDVGPEDPKQFTLIGIGNYLKIVFTKAAPQKDGNLAG